jgi:hypothetical protein
MYSSAWPKQREVNNRRNNDAENNFIGCFRAKPPLRTGAESSKNITPSRVQPCCEKKHFYQIHR